MRFTTVRIFNYKTHYNSQLSTKTGVTPKTLCLVAFQGKDPLTLR
jgi:hypothetical protein